MFDYDEFQDLVDLTDGGFVTLSPESVVLANSLLSVTSSLDFTSSGEQLTDEQSDVIDAQIARLQYELNSISRIGQTVFGVFTPQYTVINVTAPVLIAVRFKVAVAGTLKNIRYYRVLDATALDSGVLFADDGSEDVITQASFPSTGTGWLNAPVNYEIAANTDYVAAVYAPNATYVYKDSYFGSAVTVGDITFPAHTSGKPNGCYQTNPAIEFPRLGVSGGRNFFVDIEFEPS